MPEPITTIGGAAVIAYLSKDGVSKLLGPTADYLGGELKELVEKSQNNVYSVFKRAEKKCGDRLDKPGTVNPRVMKHVYDEARFCENELLSEYFGGVLASSRTKLGKDDRGVYYSQIVQALSSYQVSCHYLFYYLIWMLSKGKKLDLNDYNDRKSLTLVLPAEVYAATFNITDTKKEIVYIAHSLSGLSKSDLIGAGFEFAPPDTLKKSGVEVTSHSFVIEPTITGIELFIWAHGRGNDGLNAFLDQSLVEEPDLEIKLTELAKLKAS
ncbi:MAG: hypothetical protein Q9N67_10760 [Ghiorsea sp.]|nr:hypothetical protein [Ghiorsea sp.]